jgi:ferrous iron transport protein B
MSEPAPVFRRIAIAGNPNTGKSTIFNALTGLRQKVGNYPGVTVEKKTGRFFGSHGEAMELLDLPGSYSLQVRSPDEAVSRDVLLGRVPGTPRPDAIIAVLDASNLDRHLYLVAQFLELGIPVIVALNMVDVAEKRGLVIDLLALKNSLGVPVIPMVASCGQGLIELKQALSRATLQTSDQKAQFPIVLEREVAALSRRLKGHAGSVRAEAILLLSLEDDRLAAELKGDTALLAEIHTARERLKLSGLDPIAAPVDARYAWVSEVCASCIHRQGEDSHGLTFSDHVDQILTHKLWGWLAFIGMMSHFRRRKMADGLDHRWQRLAREPRPRAHGRRRSPQPYRGRRDRRRRQCRDLPPADSDPLLLSRAARGQRLHGARGVHHGSHDVARRAAREIIRAAAQFVRLRDPRHHGHAHD